MKFFDANVIYEAMKKAIKSGDRNRHVVQLYQVNHLLYTAMLQKALQDKTYSPSEGHKFILRERGKTRYVTNNTMIDKTVNHMLCDEILTPMLQKYLIHDNGASQKGKGVSFHRRRFREHLHKFFREHGNNDGYILFGDFSGYYANICHDKCLEVLADFFRRSDFNRDDLVLTWKILRGIFKTFRVDVSRFSDSEIQAMYSQKVDAMLNLGVDEKLLTGKKFLNKGVDIGNQTSQNIGVIFPFRLDNFAKIVMGIHGYGRYTDDFYAISSNREELLRLMDGFRFIAKEYGIIINERKSRIVKLSSFYRHLQDGYSLTETGRLIVKINPKSITRERRKLKAYKRLLNAERISYDDVENIFKSWIGSNFQRMSRRQIFNMSELYIALFRKRPKWKKGHSRLKWLMQHNKEELICSV